MKGLVKNIKQGSGVLFYTGLIHLILIPCFLVVLGLDSREVNHENVWLKPLRFAVSILLFTWTFAWFSGYVVKWKKTVNVLNLLMAMAMFIEITLISLQAVRGVASHFNVSTTFDSMVFSIMGGAIGANAMILGIWFLLFTFFDKGGKEYRASIIWGMALFLLGNFSGYIIIRYGWPADILVSYPRMPITGWKLSMDDLRISHAVGLHAIQILPMGKWLIDKLNLNSNLLHCLGIIYALFYLSTL